MRNLADLLAAKIHAQAVWEAVCKEAREASRREHISLNDRVKLDIKKQRAIQDSIRADRVYEEALRAEILADELAQSESRP